MDRDEAIKLLRGGKEGIDEWNRRRLADEKIPKLRDANLSGINLDYARLNGMDLIHADFRGSHLYSCTFVGSTILGAKFNNAKLVGTDFSLCDLGAVSFANATLSSVSFVYSNLGFCNFESCNLAECIFSGTIVTEGVLAADGLDEVTHDGPSIVDINALIQYRDKLPEEFLRGCGISAAVIQHIKSTSLEPTQFFSCMISYSTCDEEFASKLYDDLVSAGVTCWKWNKMPALAMICLRR